MLIRCAEIEPGCVIDVRSVQGVVRSFGAALQAEPGEQVIDAGGGALFRGLNAHHIHLFGLAAAQASVCCGPSAVLDREQLEHALATAVAKGGWVRGVGYHESVAGDLDRWKIDVLAPSDVPTRIQHRTGALWMLNSAAIEALDFDRVRLPRGVERRADGEPTGRIYYEDAWLREAMGSSAFPDLADVGRMLATCGVTGVCDATPEKDAHAFEALVQAVDKGALPQRVVAMGGLDAAAPSHDRIETGAVKIMLREPELPEFAALVDTVRRAHQQQRGAAFHCVTRAELVMAAAALAEAGTHAGDRIEHASITPPELLTLLADLGVSVVTQPGFVFERGDGYLVDVAPDDRPWLYRGRGFLEAGVPLGGGTDAPYGDPDPWLAIRAAVSRRTRSGLEIGHNEGLSPERALALFTSQLASPGQPSPRIDVGDEADLCLVDLPWNAFREELSRERITHTIMRGEVTWKRP